MWAMSACYVMTVNAIPTFEIITIAYSITFIFTAIKLSVKHQWSTIRQPWFLWVIGLLGVFGNDIFFVAAFKYGPPAQIDLINYLWPVFVVMFAGFLPRERFLWRHLFAALIGLMGIALLISNGQGLSGFNPKYITGYWLAFLDAIVWAIYTLAARHYNKAPIEMIGLYCGLGALLAAGLHLVFEPTVMPTHNQWAVLFIMGLTSQGFAYFLWDYGVKHGNFRLLSVLSYGNPIISIALLVFFKQSNLSVNLVLATLLVSLAGLVAAGS